MFNRLVDWAVNNRLIVLLLLVITIGVIGWQLPNLKLDAFPDVTNVQVQVNTEAEGLAAEEVEQLITYPIEAVMYALPQVAEVRSISKTGLSIVTVVFEEGTDIYFARQLVFERLQAAREIFPTASAPRKWAPTPPAWVRCINTCSPPSPAPMWMPCSCAASTMGETAAHAGGWRHRCAQLWR